MALKIYLHNATLLGLHFFFFYVPFDHFFNIFKKKLGTFTYCVLIKLEGLNIIKILASGSMGKIPLMTD